MWKAACNTRAAFFLLSRAVRMCVRGAYRIDAVIAQPQAGNTFILSFFLFTPMEQEFLKIQFLLHPPDRGMIEIAGSMIVKQ